jgi:hypothetical protein
LAKEEKANVGVCVVAALFHDVSYFVSEDNSKHGIKSAEIARDFLLKNNYSKDFVEKVAYAVESHVSEPNPRTLEAKTLQDADSLDRFGCFRILLMGKTAELSNLENLRQKLNSSLTYLGKLENGDFGPMWTRTGDKELKRLIVLNREIQKGVIEELKNTSLPEVELPL